MGGSEAGGPSARGGHGATPPFTSRRVASPWLPAAPPGCSPRAGGRDGTGSGRSRRRALRAVRPPGQLRAGNLCGFCGGVQHMPPSAPRRQGGGLCRPGPPASAAARRELSAPRVPSRRGRGRAPRPAPAGPEPCAPRAAARRSGRPCGARPAPGAVALDSGAGPVLLLLLLAGLAPESHSSRLRSYFIFSVSCRYRALSRLARAEAAIYRHRGAAREGKGWEWGERRASPAAPRLQRLLGLPAVTAAPRGSGRGREAGATRERERLFSGVSHAAAPGEAAEAAAGAQTGSGGE